MQNVLNYINQFPPEYFLVGLFFLMLLTCMGLIPSNADLTLLASAIIATNGKYPFFAVMAVTASALLIGEISMFVLGNKLGNKLFNYKLFARIMPQDKREVFKKSFVLFPNRFLLALRLSPVLRPYFYLSLGSLGLSRKTFIKYHLKWSGTYIVSVYAICYYGSKLLIDKLNSPPIYAIGAALVIWFFTLRWINKGIRSVSVQNV